MLEERKEKVNPYEGRDLDELNDDLDVLCGNCSLCRKS